MLADVLNQGCRVPKLKLNMHLSSLSAFTEVDGLVLKVATLMCEKTLYSHIP